MRGIHHTAPQIRMAISNPASGDVPRMFAILTFQAGFPANREGESISNSWAAWRLKLADPALKPDH